MFSKALYKQSWKANGILWLVTTLVSTFVLVIIMALIGGEGVGTLTSSFTETIIEQQFEANYKEISINYYVVTKEGLEEFDRSFLEELQSQIEINPILDEEAIGKAYFSAIENMTIKTNDLTNELVLEATEEQLNEYLGAALFALNPNGQFNLMYEGFELDSTPNEYDVNVIITKLMFEGTQAANNYINSKERDEYRVNRAKYGNSIFLAGNLNSEGALENIETLIKDYGITLGTYLGFGFDYEGIKYLANSAILTFESRISYEMSLNPDLTKIKVIEQLKKDMTANFLTSLPERISAMLTDVGEQDMYSQTLSNMYFKIVGVLIAIIYIIMAAVNLISRQVDSGSMAYVLATGTKRNQVSFTQSIFLVSSSFLMHLIITIVSIIVFHISTPIGSEMTVAKLIMFGLGSFLISFAFSGLNFLTSAIFNRSRKAMAIGGGVTILMLIFTILGMFGSQAMPELMRMDVLNFFNYFSIISLVSDTDIMINSLNILWKFGVLILLGITTVIIGAKVFEKKDLPL